MPVSTNVVGKVTILTNQYKLTVEHTLATGSCSAQNDTRYYKITLNTGLQAPNYASKMSRGQH